MIQFEMQQDPGSIIKVIGVGGGGSNAVNHMFKQGIKGVDFIVCNTDKQALEVSPVAHRIQLGASLTKGLGAGAIPEMGKNSAIETIDEIRKYLSDGTQMVFITAGLGGGTGTGAAPIIAQVAREMGILSVGIVTMPFVFEGKKRKQQAEAGLEEMKKYVDTLLVICNDKLREIYGNLKMSEAFAHADNVLTGAARAIAEIISMHLHINVDFNDVKTVMKDSGVAIMGTATASGERRAIRAVEQALNSPLLNDNNIRGARHVLLNIMSGSDDISMDEFGEITDYIQEASGYTAELITGYGIDPTLGDNVGVTIIATGFQSNAPKGFEPEKQQEKVVKILEDTKTTVVEEPVNIVIQTDIESVIEEVIEENPEGTRKTDEPFLIIKEVEQVTPIVVAEEVTEEVSKEVVAEITFENENEETYIEPEMTITSETKVKEESIAREVEFVITNSSSIEEITNEVQENEIVINEVEEQPDFATEEEITMELKEITISDKTENTADELTPEQQNKLEREERIRLAQERIKKLKDITLKLKSSEGLMELEKEPSFVRQNIKLDETNFSTESNVSRYTLGEGDDKKTEIRPNNYLHDNVD
ncbi:MAG TPA: cell division protein FtsZ [Bacteroidia bacterium]|jgi:cell division protein FtsZ|nr:cell division protein FtsZ [Bacteroidia bacterium]